MRRREFLTLLGGAAAWPLAARAQERMRHIAILMGIANDQEGQRRIAAFRQGLQELGWTEGRDVGFEYRWGAGDIDSIRAQARTADRAATRSHPGQLHDRGEGVEAGDAGHPDRIRASGGSGEGWNRYEPSPSWRQHHRVHQLRVHDGRKVA